MATKTNTEINGKNYFRIRRVVGHEIVDGKKKPIIKAFYGKSKSQAEKKYQEYIIRQNQLKENTVDSNKPFGEVFKFYIDNVLSVTSKYKNSTKKLYIYVSEKFITAESEFLMRQPINAATSSDIQMAYNRFDVALSTMQTLNKILRGFTKWAMANRYCGDILSAVTIPKKKSKKTSDSEIIVWTDEEIKKIENAMRGNRLRIVFFLGLYAGMRVSEILGLKYSDIYDDVIHIKRQCYYGEMTDPKYNSFRDIPMHPVLKKEFAEHQMWHKKEMKQNKYRTDLVITTPIGTACDYSTIRHKFETIYKHNGIDWKSFHTYRRTFCTNLCKANVPIQIASKLMGHKSVDVTMRFYTLVDMEQQKAAISQL